MPVSFRILPERGLVYVRYTGRAAVADSTTAFAQYAAHPDFAPGQKQLVDLSGVTDMERDFPALMAHQAQKAAAFMPAGAQALMVYFAPTEIAQRMARTILRSWDGIDAVAAVLTEDEAQALSILGLPETGFDELLPPVR